MPIYWLVGMSLKTNEEILGGFTLFPRAPTLANYIIIFTDPDWNQGYINSLTYVAINTVLSVLLALPAAYAFSRYRFLGDTHLFFWLLSNRMAPPAVFLLPFFQLYRLQARDDYTVAHSLNVCVMVVAQASHRDLSEAAIRDIGLAALLHDIGKEFVPAEILNKPGKLDPGEFAKVSLHPVLGATHLRRGCPWEATFPSSSATSTTSATIGPGIHLPLPGRSAPRLPHDPDRRRVRRPEDVPAVPHESRPGDGPRHSPRGAGDGVRARVPRPLSPDGLLIPVDRFLVSTIRIQSATGIRNEPT